MKKITLIQNWFNSEFRHSEYLSCLKKNDKNSNIHKIILLCNDRHDDLKKLSKKVICLDIKQSPTFAEFFQISNILCRDEICIVANLDICFDSSIANVYKFISEKNVLALCRWDMLEDGTKRFFNKTDSQDAWIFEAPLDTSEMNAGFTMGTAGCDNRIAFELSRKHQVLGTSKDIVATHIHLSQFRQWLKDGKEVYRLPSEDGYGFVGIVEKNYISFSLFETKMNQSHRTWDEYVSPVRYWYNIPAICAIYRTLFPEHVIRMYVSENTKNNPKFSLLTKLHWAGIISMKTMPDDYVACEPTFWRFQPIFDKNIDSVLVRDIDSIPSSAEVAATDYFIRGQAIAYNMRGHTNHCAETTMVLAGLCGFKPSKIQHQLDYDSFFKKYVKKTWGCDQDGLIDYVCRQLNIQNQNFLDFAISSKNHNVSKPAYKPCTHISNPKLEQSSEIYINNKELINILDQLSGWTGQPVDIRGDKLKRILAECGEIGQEIRDIVYSSGVGDFYGV